MNLPRRRGNEVGAAHDVGNALLGIVYGTGEVVGEHLVRSVNHEISDFGLQDLAYVPLQSVVEFDHCGVGAYPQCARFAPGCQCPTAGARIYRAFHAGQSRIADLPAAAGAGIGVARLQQLMQRRVVGVVTRALVHNRAVPMHAECIQAAQDRVGRSRYRARRIKVIDAHQPGATARPRVEETANRRHHRTEVQRPRRRRREPPTIDCHENPVRKRGLYIFIRKDFIAAARECSAHRRLQR